MTISRPPATAPRASSRAVEALRMREHDLASRVDRHERAMRGCRRPALVSLGRELDDTRSRLAQVRRELRRVHTVAR